MNGLVTAKTWLVLWLVLTWLWVIHSFYLVSFDRGVNHRGHGTGSDGRHSSSVSQIFPSVRCPAFKTPYQILKVETEQKTVPTLSLLVLTLRHDRYQLWSTLPYALSPPPLVVYEADERFDFVANDDGNMVVVVEARQLLLLRRSDLSRATLGSWKTKQVWPLMERESQSVPQIVMSRDGALALVVAEFGLTALYRLWVDHHYLQPATMDSVRIDFALYPRSILLEHQLLVTGCPDFRQLDGVVDVYVCRDADLENITWLQTLSPPTRGTYFGAHVATASLRNTPLVLVAAPFAHRGTGALYVYSRPSGSALFQLGQTIQGASSVEQLARWFAVSENGLFIVLSTTRSLCLLAYDAPTNGYRHTKEFSDVGGEHLQSLHVDNDGNVIYATSTHVMIPAHAATVQ